MFGSTRLGRWEVCVRRRLTGRAIAFGALVAISIVGCDRAAEHDGASAFRDRFLAGEVEWDAVVERARSEGRVEFYHWGGSEALNSWFELIARPAIESIGIGVHFRRSDTRDVVDLILSEIASGRGPGSGSVDVVWINGENFRTLRMNDALFGAFADRLPSSVNFAFDPDDPGSSINRFDFGTPTDLMEMPWAGFQFTVRVDADRLDPAEAPATFAALEPWARANPGRFTYVAPPHYIGSTFIHALLYETNPDSDGYTPFLNEPSDLGVTEFARLIGPGFEYLRRIEPYLLGGGGRSGVQGAPIYPASAAALQARFVAGEVDFDMEFGVYDVDRDIRSGRYPPTVRNIIFPESGMIKDMSYLAIPRNAPAPAAALVAIDALSTPESHLSKLVEIGFAPAIDPARLDREERARFLAAAPDLRGVTEEALAARAVPSVNAGLVDVIDAIWLEYIAEQSARSFDEIVLDAWRNLGL